MKKSRAAWLSVFVIVSLTLVLSQHLWEPDNVASAAISAPDETPRDEIARAKQPLLEPEAGRAAVASIGETTPAPPIDVPALRGGEHAEYGTFASMDELRGYLTTLIGDPFGDDYLQDKLMWKSSEGKSRTIPWGRFAPDGIISESARLEALQVAAESDALIESHAALLRRTFHECVADYIRHSLGRTKRSERWTRKLTAEGGLPPMSYTRFTVVPQGHYNYIVDFRSCDYPRLEQLIGEMDQVVQQREAAVRQALGR